MGRNYRGHYLRLRRRNDMAEADQTETHISRHVPTLAFLSESKTISNYDSHRCCKLKMEWGGCCGWGIHSRLAMALD